HCGIVCIVSCLLLSFFFCLSLFTSSTFFFSSFFFFFINVPATTEIYTLSLHDALPIYFITQLLKIFTVFLYLRSFVNRNAFSHKDRKSTRLNSSHVSISYAVFCLKKKKKYSYTTLEN